MSSFFNLTRLKQIFSRPSFLCCSLPEDAEQTLRKVHIPPCLPGIRGTYNSFFSCDLAEQSGKGGPILYGCSLGQNFPAPDASTSTGLHSFDNIQFFAKYKLMQLHQLLIYTYYTIYLLAKFWCFFFSTCTVVTRGSPCVHPLWPVVWKNICIHGPAPLIQSVQTKNPSSPSTSSEQKTEPDMLKHQGVSHIQLLSVLSLGLGNLVLLITSEHPLLSL